MRTPKQIVKGISLTIIILGLTLAFLTGQAFAQGGNWTTKAPMPTARAASIVGVVNGILYVAAGYNPALGGHITPVEAYDPVANSWTSKNPKPDVQTSAAAGVVNGILYAAGGTNCCVEIADLTAYDPTTDTWATKAPLPAVRQAAGARVINGQLHVVGGHAFGQALTSHEVYDPVANTWTTKAPMPTARTRPGIGVVNGILYAVGGHNLTDVLATVEAYDPTTNTWTTKAPMPTARGFLDIGVVNGILYAVGGQNATGVLATVEAYDPTTDTWTTIAPMPTARTFLEVDVVGGLLYAVGGFGSNGSVAIGTVEAFIPWVPTLAVSIFADGHDVFGTSTDGLPISVDISFGHHQAVATAEYGILGAFASTGAPDPTGDLCCVVVHGSAARASWQDTFLIGGGTGLGFFRMSVRLRGHLAADTDVPQFGSGVSFGMAGNPFQGGGHFSVRTGFGAFVGVTSLDIDEIFGFQQTFEYGVAFHVFAQLDVFASAIGALSSTSDFIGAIVTSAVVIDPATGLPATGAVIRTGSGTDYSNLGPPTLSLPANITVDATSPSGAVVTYIASATDQTGSVPVTCNPPSGNTFAIGGTVVSCTTTNQAGTTSGAFQVLVQAAAAQVTNLITTVQSFNLAQGIINSLDAKLLNVLSALSAAKAGSPASTCNQLTAFINQTLAQSGKQLTVDQANQLITSANRIKAVIGCP